MVVLLIPGKLLLLMSHYISTPVIPLYVHRIFLAYINMVIHKRSGILGSAEITLNLPVFASVMMSVKLCKSLTITTKWARNSLLGLRFFWGLLTCAQILSNIHFREWIRLSSGLLEMLLFRFFVIRFFLFFRVLRYTAGFELWHSLATAFVN